MVDNRIGTPSPVGEFVPDKSGKSTVYQALPGNQWGTFVSGNGEFVSANADSNASGYDFITGGVTLGVDNRINDNLALGVAFNYAYNSANLVDSGRVTANGEKLGAFATYFNGGYYANGYVGAGVNDYTLKRSSLGGIASGDTDGAEVNAFLSSGYDFRHGAFTYGPVGSVQFTNVSLNGYKERGSLTPLEIETQNDYSLATELGYRVAWLGEVNGVGVRPEVKVSWQHQYGDVALPIEASFANGEGGLFTTYGPNLGRDRAVISLGVSVIVNPRLETFLNVNGSFGSAIQSENVSAGLKVSF
jgi:uncharacterized protein with beta-barrel porin domain